MTQTTIPARFWTRKASAALAAALFASVLVTACDADRMSVEQYLTRAEEFRDKGDLNASIIEAKNALQLDSERHDARFILGLNYLDLGAWSAAEAMLERVMKDGGVLEYAAIPPLARAKIALAKYDQVLEFARLQEGMKGGLKADILVVRGQALNAIGKTEEARKNLEEALQSDPASFAAYIGLATSAVAENDPKEAREMLAKASEIAPDAADVLLFRGSFEYREQNFEASKEAFRKLVGIRPERPDFYLGQARAEIALDEFQQAIKSLEYPLKAWPKHPGVNYLKALAAYKVKDYQAALTHVEIVLSQAPTDARAQLIAASSAFALARYERALDWAKKVLERMPDLEVARELLGFVQLKLGKPEDAFSTLESLAEKENASVAVLNLVGNAALLSRNLEAGTGYLERIVALDPKNDSARTLLAKALIDGGNVDRGIEELKEAIQGDAQVPHTKIVLVLSLLKTKRYAEAEEATNRFIEKWPNKSIGHTTAGLVHFAKGDLGKAATSFQRALEIEPGAADAATNLASVAIVSKKYAEARDILKEALKHRPRHPRILSTLAEVETHLNEFDAAIRTYEQLLEIRPEALRPRLTLSKLLLRAGRVEKAYLVLKRVSVQHEREPAVLEILGQTQLQLRKSGEAIETFKVLAAVKPNSPEAKFLLAISYAAGSQLDESQKELEGALSLDPKHTRSKLALADVLLRQSELVKASTIIDELASELSDSAEYLTLRGRLALRQGKPKEAVEAFVVAQKTLKTSHLISLLAMAQILSEERDAGLETLDAWLIEHPEDLTIRFQLANNYMMFQEYEAARREFHYLHQKQPKNWIFLNNLADALGKMGKYGDALGFARMAYDIAPAQPAVLDTYGVILLESGDSEQALFILQSASKRAPDNPEIAFNVARAFEKEGKLDEARAILKEILPTRNVFRSREEAENLLKKLGG